MANIYDELNSVIKTQDKTPREIVNILNETQYKIGSKSIPKMIEALNSKGIKAGKTGGRFDGNAIEVEGQFFEYQGAKEGWKWTSGAANRSVRGSYSEKNWRHNYSSDPSKVDTSKLPSHEDYRKKRNERYESNKISDPLEKGGYFSGNAGVRDLKDKKRSITYHTEALEKAKQNYEKALDQYRRDYEYHSKALAKAIGEKDQFMVEFRKKFGEALRK